MRKIEQQMLAAIQSKAIAWTKDNTGVFYENNNTKFGPRSEIYLHGNHIADFWHRDGELTVNEHTLIKWPTPTTKSRLRALGANVTTKKGTTYLNGVPCIPY